jgi:Ricin-type beta-trefoil lectin domain/Chitin recognition protein
MPAVIPKHVVTLCILLFLLVITSSKLRRECYADVGPVATDNPIPPEKALTVHDVLTYTGEQMVYKSIPEGERCVVKGVMMPSQFRKPSNKFKELYPDKEACVLRGSETGVKKMCMDKNSALNDMYVTSAVKFISGKDEHGSREMQCLVAFNPMANGQQLMDYALKNDIHRQKELLESANEVLKQLNAVLTANLRALETLYREALISAAHERQIMTMTINGLRWQVNTQRDIINNLETARDALQAEVNAGKELNRRNVRMINDLQATLLTARDELRREEDRSRNLANQVSSQQNQLNQANSEINRLNTALANAPPPESKNGRCGDDYKTRCPGNQCCSQFGWCDRTREHCLTMKRSDTKYDGPSMTAWVDPPPPPPPSFNPQGQLILSDLRGGGFCVDVHEESRENGKQMVMWDCHGNANQRWRMDGAARLISNHSNKCLDVYGGRTDNMAPVIQWDCHDGNNQKWDIDAQRRLRPRNAPGKCLDVYSGNTANGAQLIIYDCHDGANQKWSAF